MKSTDKEVENEWERARARKSRKEAPGAAEEAEMSREKLRTLEELVQKGDQDDQHLRQACMPCSGITAREPSLPRTNWGTLKALRYLLEK